MAISQPGLSRWGFRSCAPGGRGGFYSGLSTGHSGPSWQSPQSTQHQLTHSQAISTIEVRAPPLSHPFVSSGRRRREWTLVDQLHGSLSQFSSWNVRAKSHLLNSDSTTAKSLAWRCRGRLWGGESHHLPLCR